MVKLKKIKKNFSLMIMMKITINLAVKTETY